MKRILASLFALIIGGTLLAQVPQKIAYQAVVRNANGQAITNQEVSVRISLLAGSVAGDAVYTETHNVTSTPIGIINLTIGEGSMPSGSMLDVPWSDGIFIKLEIDPAGGTTYVDMGTNQLVSVPYALQAGGLARGAIEVKPTPGHDPEAPIFVVRNSNNEVVFAVYESGVRAYIDDTGKTKSTRGGFAIGGLADQTKGAKETNYLTIQPDSVRFNIQQPAKGKNARGGFAIGGLADQTKEVTGDYLTLRPDSIRFAIDESLLDKNNRGGFAIGGLADQTKVFTNYFMVNRDCTYVMNTLTAAGNVIVAGDMMTGGTIGSMPLTDIDGNVYQTVRIGTQMWMAENLRVLRYNDGTPIVSALFNDMPPIYNYDDGDQSFDPVDWGYLYALQAIDFTDKNICPTGWRLPNYMDWEMLISTIGGNEQAINLIDNTPGYWWESKSSKLATGFKARPGGYFEVETFNTENPWFNGAHFNAYFWSQPEDMEGTWVSYVYNINNFSSMYSIYYNETYFYETPEYYYGYSVRCIKGEALVTP
jgi:uncharacterized protein (TIGR02145 family)